MATNLHDDHGLVEKTLDATHKDSQEASCTVVCQARLV